MCSAEQLESDAFRDWCRRLGDRFSLHRKLWEWGYICQALSERGMLSSGKRGLGFAVGKEPLPSLFASLGCEIVATDLDAADPRGANWSATNQLAAADSELNLRGLCDAETFRRRVAFRRVDMNRIPDDLDGFDFTWSSCSFEHCGSIERGQEFVFRQMNCLKAGGVAVHTTEFNLSSNSRTIAVGETVIYRRRDVEQLARRLIAAGHHVEPFDLTFDADRLEEGAARAEAVPAGHLNVRLGPYLATSIGLIVHKGNVPLRTERR
ncbi:MAG: SAM-dependent methyltransferase [Planctomycetia bacterium]|nr:SAM-dependent methyltransferase [Planctomycetia bacterium]